MDWLERVTWLVELPPRPPDFRVLDRQNVNLPAAERLADAAQRCWQHLLTKDTKRFAQAVTDSFQAQQQMFPLMVPPDLQKDVAQLASQAMGMKLCGAGGGGYALLVSEDPIESGIHVQIQRKNKVLRD